MLANKTDAKVNYFNEAYSNGFFVRLENGSLWSGYNGASLIDLTNKNAVDFYVKIIRENLIGSGVVGWMADFGESLPLDASLFDKKVDPLSFHNQYPVEWQKLNERAVSGSVHYASKNLSVPIVYFCRSGGTKSPAHTSLFWQGDQLVVWNHFDGLKTAILCLSFSTNFSL